VHGHDNERNDHKHVPKNVDIAHMCRSVNDV